MIRGVLRNKYALTEDQLTSSVWGTLELLPPRVILDWIACARPWGSAIREPLRFDDEADVEMVFWPATRAHGEPDLLVLVSGPLRVDAVLIEAKHGTGKSQWSSLDEEDELAHRKYDQLVRYWSALRERDFVGIDPHRLARARATVVYLTPHLAPPRADLDESCRREPAIRLAWLSWRDLDALLAAARATEHAEKRVIASLRALLGHLGLVSFAGVGRRAHAATVDASKMWHFDAGRLVGGARVVVRELPAWKFSGE